MKQFDIKKLSNREQQIITLIAHEFSTKDIADELFIHFETVKSHRRNLFKKLDVSNAAGLVRVAFEKGILSLSI